MKAMKGQHKFDICFQEVLIDLKSKLQRSNLTGTHSPPTLRQKCYCLIQVIAYCAR